MEEQENSSAEVLTKEAPENTQDHDTLLALNVDDGGEGETDAARIAGMEDTVVEQAGTVAEQPGDIAADIPADEQVVVASVGDSSPDPVADEVAPAVDTVPPGEQHGEAVSTLDSVIKDAMARINVEGYQAEHSALAHLRVAVHDMPVDAQAVLASFITLTVKDKS